MNGRDLCQWPRHNVSKGLPLKEMKIKRNSKISPTHPGLVAGAFDKASEIVVIQRNADIIGWEKGIKVCLGKRH